MVLYFSGLKTVRLEWGLESTSLSNLSAGEGLSQEDHHELRLHSELRAQFKLEYGALSQNNKNK